jgi:hypothetical protein
MNSVISKLWPSILCGSVVFIAAVSTVNAALLEGKSISVQSAHLTSSSSPETGVQTPDFIVGPGVELMNFPNALRPIIPLGVDIDISDRSILITLLADQPSAFQEVIRFIDSNDAVNITHAAINPATNWAGFAQNRVSLSGSSLAVNVSQLSGLQGQQILLDVVPEPAAAGLLLVGIGAVIPRLLRRAGSQAFDLAVEIDV